MTNDDPDRPDGGDHDAADAGEACCGSDGCDTAAGAASGDADEGAEVRFSVPEMDCSSCASKVDAALSDREGVVATDLRPTAGTATVTYDAERTTRADLVAAVESAGYPVADDGSASASGDADDAAVGAGSVFRSARAKRTALSGLFLGLGLLVQFGLAGLNGSLVAVAGRELAVADALYLLAVLAGGEVIVRNGYYSARNLSLDIDFLMSVAILSATGISLAVPDLHFYVEAASLAVLFNVAELLERYSVDRARNSLEELLTLSPDVATVRRATGPDGETERVEVPVEDVAVGETVLVEPGEKIPMDGTVTEGSSAVNQAPITGESVPVDKAVGDEVFAGTINEQGFLAVETTAAAGDTTIDRIVELVEDAQANKTDREQFVERFADYYTPAVVAAALLATFVAPVVLGGGWATWFVRGISLLVIACPCAFVISTPVTVVSGVTSAAKNGVLIKGGNHLEAMGEVDAVAFDKTGTLTTGELSVTDVVGLNGNDEANVLACARAIERRSEHPIGDAIVAHADERGVADREVTDFESITGKGVRADLDGRTHYAGKPGLFADLGFDLGHVHLTGGEAVTDGGVAVEAAKSPCADRDDCVDLVETVPRLQSEGKTVVLVGTEAEIEGVVAIADEVRPEARRTVERLREQGVDHLVMLTGDNERTAGAVAERVGVDEFHADLLPDEKVDRVEALREEYDTVAMVGDGINDAPALATASVGVAMGAAGTDTALETADVALMGDDLSKLPYLHRLARTGNGIIRQNVWGSLLVKAALAVAIPLPFVAVPLWFVVLAGDVGMTTAVTGNAMRLARLRPDPATA
ncbi:cation-translocating P-type ATPase [Halosimplex rubrum]|uniref:Cation-translocating P-type ATPase n=1 Tax=Halosimplex rubrum TaxID=869889 RepID=A0A7D5SSM0_9EURY|nr:cation-translocating P-type ATPase [Halosimplex rubrum]QLH79747.1 cation-translocating P-type ATPase [Halosimplex rubrum]